MWKVLNDSSGFNQHQELEQGLEKLKSTSWVLCGVKIRLVLQHLPKPRRGAALATTGAMMTLRAKAAPVPMLIKSQIPQGNPSMWGAVYKSQKVASSGLLPAPNWFGGILQTSEALSRSIAKAASSMLG